MTSPDTTPDAIPDASPGTTGARRTVARKRASAQLREAKQDRLDEFFRGRKFDIVREVHLDEDHVFKTRFGNLGRHGYVLKDRATGEELVVGRTLLRLIHDRYLGVNLPRVRKTVNHPDP